MSSLLARLSGTIPAGCLFTETKDTVVSEQKTPAVMMKAASLASVAVALTLVAVKGAAVVVTGSVAVLSGLIDSAIDAFASLLAFWSIRESLTPADSDHRFGHGKIEALAAVGQAAFIAGSAVLLLFEAVLTLFRPRSVEQTTVGIAVMVFSMLLTAGLVAFQRFVVRRTGSMAVSADCAHYAGDVLMNLGIIASLIVSARFGLNWTDPVFALGIAAYLLINAFAVAKKALGQLIDAELPDDEKRKIADIVLASPDVVGLHDLRTRASGTRWFVQLHLEICPDFSLMKAHAVADEVERRLNEAFPHAEILIHQDPAGLREKIPEWSCEK